jgi:uncharacterized protein YjcR
MQVQFLLRALSEQKQRKKAVKHLETWQKAYKDYTKGMSYKEIAEKYGVSTSTVNTWRSRHNWQKRNNSKSEIKKIGAPYGNKNAVGSKGGDGAPVGNKRAERHGFFSKYLPAETLEIIQDIENKTPVDLLLDQIELQYAAIIRAQKLMLVKDREDKTVEIISVSEAGVHYEIQQAWDKQEKFLNAQSRAVTALNGLIRQYDEMIKYDEQKAEISKERKARIDKIKAETKRLKEDKQDGKSTVTVIMQGDVSQYAE